MPRPPKTPCRAAGRPQAAVNFALLKLENDVVLIAEWVAHAWRTERRDSLRMAMLLQELNRAVLELHAARDTPR
jgi:hypothetical protein